RRREPVEAALEFDIGLLQQLADGLETLVETQSALIEGNPETGEFVGQEGPGETDLEPPAADRVEHADLAGQFQRVVEDRQHRSGDQAKTPAPLGGGGKEHDRAGRVAAIVVAVVLDDPDVVVAQHIGAFDEVEAFTEVASGRFLLRSDIREEVDTDVHPAGLPGYSTDASIVRMRKVLRSGSRCQAWVPPSEDEPAE